jgi:hypothetical protein
MLPHRFLFFVNGNGLAVYGDTQKQLRKCPRLSGMRFIEIEYAPRTKARVLAENAPDHWRPMTDDECLIADHTLKRMHDLSSSVFE